jgi:hypoxanthine phosphoribosyltransferase
MKNTEKYEVPTWDQVHTLLINQAEKICASSYKPSAIVGIVRGGVVPARILSDLLGNKNFTTIHMKSNHASPEDRRKKNLIRSLAFSVAGKKVLLVDDVADTGRTLADLEEYMQQQGAKETRIATLYSKPWSVIKPDYYEKETVRWIIFPWDVTEHLRGIVTKEVMPPSTKEISGLPEKLTTRILNRIQGEKRC